MWGVSLGQIHLGSLGREGLATAFPVTWYAALGTVVVGGVYACFARRTSGWVMAAYAAGAVVVLYTTLPALTGVPDGVWVYKHIGVTRFIAAHGGPKPSTDIYNQFPGLFTAVVFTPGSMITLTGPALTRADAADLARRLRQF